MTMQDAWTDRLSEYLDDELTADERRGLEAHLAGCADCAVALDELKRVIERAGTLPSTPPREDLWDGVASRIGGKREPRRVSFTLPQLAAASILLAVVSGGAAWRLHSALPATSGIVAARAGDRGVAAAPEARGADAGAGDARLEPIGVVDAQYDSAVADLQRALDKGRGHLDPATIAVVQQSLLIIDRALDQARQAVVDDPGNSYLTSHLVETRRKKLDLLRRAAALASETN
jgi:anti-sigma factor RsiW